MAISRRMNKLWYSQTMGHCATVKKEMVIILLCHVIKRETQVVEEHLLADAFCILKFMCVCVREVCLKYTEKSLGSLHTKHINSVYLW